MTEKAAENSVEIAAEKTAERSAETKDGRKRSGATSKKSAQKSVKNDARTGDALEKTDEEKLRSIWSRAMALRGLKRVMNVSLEAAKIPTLDENGEVIEVKFNPSAANAATKAIETANKMLGYNLPESYDDEDADDESEVTVVFENAEEYSS